MNENRVRSKVKGKLNSDTRDVEEKAGGPITEVDIDEAAQQAGISEGRAEQILMDYNLWNSGTPGQRLTAYYHELDDREFASLLGYL